MRFKIPIGAVVSLPDSAQIRVLRTDETRCAIRLIRCLTCAWNRSRPEDTCHRYEDDQRDRVVKWLLHSEKPSAGLLFILGIIRVGPTQEQSSPIGKRDRTAIRSILSVLGLVAMDHELCPNRQRISVEASPEHGIRSTGFDLPRFDSTVLGFHFEGHPAVRIDPFHLL